MFFSSGQSFWHDELFSIGIAGKGTTFTEMLLNYLKYDTYNLPLYQIVLYFWCRIVPFKEETLLIISEISLCIGIFALGEAQRKLFGNFAGLIIVVLAATSSSLMIFVGWELRAYAFLFMFVSLFLWLETDAQTQTHFNVKEMLVVALMLYCHYFGAVFLAIWSFLKLLNAVYYKKKHNLWIKTYAAGCGLFVPWMIGIVLNNTRSFASFWPDVPDFSSIISLLNYLTSDRIFLILLLLGTVIAVIEYCEDLRKGEADERHAFLIRNAAAFIIGVMMVFIYSTAINPKGSIWVERYFLCFLPGILMLTAYGLEKVFKHLNIPPEILAAIYIIFSLFSCKYAVNYMNWLSEDYRSAGRIISEIERDNHSDTVYVYLTESDFTALTAAKGFREMYLSDIDSVTTGVITGIVADNPKQFWISAVHKKIDDETMAFLNDNCTIVYSNPDIGIYKYEIN